MSLKPIQQVLTDIRSHQWQKEQEFAHLLDLWSQIVGAVVAAQAQPIQVTSSRVLLVATASSVWAQNLAFERSRILIKLNAQVQEPLIDIRFSTSQWSPRKRRGLGQTLPPSMHNRSTPHGPDQRPDLAVEIDAHVAFERWSQRIKSQAQGHCPCPICGCPTPKAELQRWGRCGLCAVRNPESTVI